MSFGTTARRGCVAVALALWVGMFWASSAAGQVDDLEDEPMEAADAAPRENGDADWMPSLGFNFGFHTQSMDGTTSSSESTLTPGNGDSYISQLVGFEGRLYTPLYFDDLPTKPRVFLASSYHVPLAEGLIAERIEANFAQSDPDFAANCATTIPGLDGNPVASQTCSVRVRNRLTVEHMFSAGLGLDLTLPIDEDQFHIQPSIDYFGMSVQSVGEFRRTSRGARANDFVETADTVGDEEYYHAISPAITFLVDVYEEGPFRWSMWMQGRVMFFLNEPSIRSSSSLGTNQIGFQVEIDDFAPQATMGFHVTYTGKNRRR